MGLKWKMASITLAVLLASRVTAFESGRSGFTVAYAGEKSPYQVNAVFLMPGETLDVKVFEKDGPGFSLLLPDGSTLPGAARRGWSWVAPRVAGLYPLIIRRSGGDSLSPGKTSLLNAFVMVPASELKGGYLRGYRVGKYPGTPLKGLTFYKPPKGFVEVTPELRATPLSPHFRLEQFLCKQSPALPAFLVLKERLILKLETVLEKVNENGYACQGFHVMSGYRTPFYNRSIGNVKYSVHQWGGAADIFIDEHPVDGTMDDLNGDGKSDGKDSGILFEIVDRMSRNEFYLPYLGGVGKYSENRTRGPFVHVDVRGFRALW